MTRRADIMGLVLTNLHAIPEYCDVIADALNLVVRYVDPVKGPAHCRGRDWWIGSAWEEDRLRKWLREDYGLVLIGADYRNATIRLRRL